MVLGVLPALDATRCLLSVEAPAAGGPSLLSLNPVEVASRQPQTSAPNLASTLPPARRSKPGHLMVQVELV